MTNTSDSLLNMKSWIDNWGYGTRTDLIRLFPNEKAFYRQWKSLEKMGYIKTKMPKEWKTLRIKDYMWDTDYTKRWLIQNVLESNFKNKMKLIEQIENAKSKDRIFKNHRVMYCSPEFYYKWIEK